MSTPAKVITIVALLALAVAAMLLGACGDPASPLQPVTCATYQAPDGTWMEEDNEPVDADPCDREFDVHRTNSPAAKPKPVKTPVKPAPRTTRR